MVIANGHIYCNYLPTYLPTYRSLRLPDYPIENIGMQADLYLDNSIKDWAKFAFDYLAYCGKSII